MLNLHDLNSAIHWRKSIDLNKYPTTGFQATDGILKYFYVYKSIQKFLNLNTSTVLDIGSSDLYFSKYIASLGHKVLAIDVLSFGEIKNYSKLRVEYYLKKFTEWFGRPKNFTFMKISFRALPSDRKFKVIVDCCSLIHISSNRNDFISLLQKVKNHLEPGGYFVMVCDVYFGPFGYLHEFYTEKDLSLILEQVGFTNIDSVDSNLSPNYFFGHSLYNEKPLILGISGFVLQA
jgi:SAM-dependent methyltransferase